MLEAIQLMFRDYILYKMVIKKICFLGDYFKRVFMPFIPIFFYLVFPHNLSFFKFFRGGLRALEILDTLLLLGYTLIAHSV